MSFRNRLRLFFLMIVVAPMLVVAVVLYLVTFTSESGKSDADVNARTQVRRKMNDEAHRQALAAGRAIVNDVPFATAIRRNDAEQLQTRASDLLRRRGVQRIVVAKGTNRAIVDVGNAAATFPAAINLVDGKKRFGTLEVARTTPAQYAREVKRTTGLETVVSREGGEGLASTLRAREAARGGAGGAPPPPGPGPPRFPPPSTAASTAPSRSCATGSSAAASRS